MSNFGVWWWRIRSFFRRHHAQMYRVRLWALFVGFLLASMAWRLQNQPPVGVCIAIMGFVIALMALPKEPTGWERFLWITVITALMFAEIRNIYATDKAQTQTSQAILCGLQEANSGLQNTNDSLRDTENDLRVINGLEKDNLSAARDTIR